MGERASVAGVIARAGVPASEFYARYTTLEDCALDFFERLLASYRRRVAEAFNSHSSWRDSLRAAAYAAADYLAENPLATDFGIVGVLKMNSELCRVRREETFIFCGELIDLGRTEPSDIEIDEAAGMFGVGSIVQLLTYRLQTGIPAEPHAIVPEMMYAVVRAYKGEEEAREELSLPRTVAT
jgi:AcrR family transcriptional regulator